MPLGSSSAAPVMSPGPSRLHQRPRSSPAPSEVPLRGGVLIVVFSTAEFNMGATSPGRTGRRIGAGRFLLWDFVESARAMRHRTTWRARSAGYGRFHFHPATSRSPSMPSPQDTSSQDTSEVTEQQRK